MGKPENRSLIQEIRGTDESTLARDSSVPFMHRDPTDLRSMIPFRLLISQRNPCTLSLPGQGGISNFTVPVCSFPGATFTYQAYIIYARLKKTKQRPDGNQQPDGKFDDRVTFFFFQKPGENIDTTGCVAERCNVRKWKETGVYQSSTCRQFCLTEKRSKY